jgi:hypothetical protein
MLFYVLLRELVRLCTAVIANYCNGWMATLLSANYRTCGSSACDIGWKRYFLVVVVVVVVVAA